MTTETKRELRQQLAECTGCVAEEFVGQKLGDALQSVDHAPVIVYWGCWSDADLAETL